MSKATNWRNQEIEEATEEEQEEVRDSVEKFGVKRKNSGGTKKIHIPDEEGTGIMCKTPHGKITFKDKAAIPPGYWPLCKNCIHHWRMG